MIRRVAFVTDCHTRATDISTIRGYVKNNINNKCRLLEFIRQAGITDLIEGGDWYDGGFGSDTSAYSTLMEYDRIIAEELHGNFYGCIGNHLKSKMDSNPELFLIQPHPVYKLRFDVPREEQIIKTPKSLMINGVEFKFHHHVKGSLGIADYYMKNNPLAKHSIGIYHTEHVIPAATMQANNIMFATSASNDIDYVTAGEEYALDGHIHKPLPITTIVHEDGSTTQLIVPGSLSNTDAGLGSRHDKVSIPVFTIQENGDYSVEFYDFDLHLEEVTFLKDEIAEEDSKKLRSIRGNTQKSLYEAVVAQYSVGGNGGALCSFETFMDKQQYTQTDKRAVKTVVDDPRNVIKLVQLYKADQLEE